MKSEATLKTGTGADDGERPGRVSSGPGRQWNSLAFGSCAFLLGLLVMAPARAVDAHRIPDAPPEYLKMVNSVDLDKLDKRARRKVARLYKNKCRKCHGKEGDGKGPGAEFLQIKPPAFSKTGYLAGRKDGQLFWIIVKGSPGTDMVPRGAGTRENLSEQEIWRLIAYIRRTFTR